MRKIISLICLLLPALTFASPSEPPQLRSDAPDKHIVIKGDTLWDISAEFFKDPWKWQYIWGMNKESIKDPHWIYPGDVIYLDRINGTLSVGKPPLSAHSSGYADRPVVRLSPQVQQSQSSHDAIPTIPVNAIAPFLSRPLIVSETELKAAPTLIGAREGRVILGKGDAGFVQGLPVDKGGNWQFYRPGKPLTDPDTKENLGLEATYLGRAEVANFADVSTVIITESKQEISKGDRLMVSSADSRSDYFPHAPEANISARIISVYGGVSQAGQNTIITLNKGKRDGVEVGHVLALYHRGESVTHDGHDYTLPDERYGLTFVFRVFDKVSYALVMNTRLPAQLLDRAQTP